MKRRTKFILILGYNGTGKSTFVEKMIQSAMKTNRRVLVCTPHDVEWLKYDLIETNKNILNFKGVKRKIIFDLSDLENILQYYRNGLLIFDDCRVYFNSTTNQLIRKLMIERRQKMLDVVAVGHGFTEVPPAFFTFASELVLFKTNDNIKKRKDVINNFELLEKEKNEIDNNAIKQPYFYKIINLMQ